MRSIRARSLRNRLLAPLAALCALTLSACDSAPPPVDSGDAGHPAPDLALPGLEGPVEVLYDDRGVPHIYATTTHDVLLAQGYLVSRDRFAQMELMRRSAVGRLAEIAGPSAIADDTVARWAGHGRMGEEIYASLPEDDVARRAAEAFVEGVNLYIDAVNRREEDPAVEGAEILNVVLSSPWFGHWSPSDVFALARYQSASLSFYPRSDVERSLRLAAVLAAFPADADDARARARSGLYEDLFTQAPARPVFTREGFPDEAATALVPTLEPRADTRFTPQLRALRGALPFLDRLEASSEQVFGDSVTRGSNVWAVAGEHTASGHPILADDPHLALISPAVWWYVHLDTARMGGEDALEVEGTAFPGLPGVIVGFNRRVAWGVAATGDDVTDAYQEDLAGECDAQGDVASGTVRHLGAEHPVAAREEAIRVAGADDVIVRLPYPSHRPESQFVPGSCVATGEGRATAISIRYTGWGPSNELAAFFGLMRARDAQEGLAALEHFEVGSQNFVVIDQDEVVWSTRARLPVRDPRARTLTIERGSPRARVRTCCSRERASTSGSAISRAPRFPTSSRPRPGGSPPPTRTTSASRPTATPATTATTSGSATTRAGAPAASTSASPPSWRAEAWSLPT